MPRDDLKIEHLSQSLEKELSKKIKSGRLPSVKNQLRGENKMKQTAKCIIKNDDRILLIKHQNEPQGWAIPGGEIEHHLQMVLVEVRKKRN